GKDVFCRRLEAWPDAADIIEEVPVEACWRVGQAVHLTLRRPRARRSLFVWTRDKAGREVIFWRSQTSLHAARPGIRVPQARGLEGPLEIAVDVAERYAWRFAGHEVTLRRRGLPVGDYAVLRDDTVIAAVERKSPADLATAAVAGRLNLALGDLAKAPHAALVIEGRIGDVIKAARAGGAKLAREALSGTAWTSRDAAARCRVTQPTAAADLAKLARDGVLNVEGAGRTRRYVAASASLNLGR